MVHYSTNWMGPVNIQWYRDRGLAVEVTKVCDFDSKYSNLKRGDTYKYWDITEHYSAGRIDISTGDEYGLAPMKSEDWSLLSNWLDDYVTPEVVSKQTLIADFEKHLKRSIRWASDNS